MRRTLLTITALLSILVLPRGALAGERLILRMSPDVVEQVCADHDLRVVREIGRSHLTLVETRGPADPEALAARLRADARIYDFETPRRKFVLDAPSSASVSRRVAPETIDRSPTSLEGTSVWSGYVDQAAVQRIGGDAARASGATGTGVVVAVIDTGVDPGHPVLAGALLPGYDFTREARDASEWTDLSAEQSTAVIPLQSTAVIPLQSTAVIPLQSTAVIPLQSTAVIPVGLPPAFGHGTMVAGLIHLVAPAARILPLKVISAEGAGATEDLIAAIYYAVDHGAKVINMSLSADSREVKRAIQYATNRGVICVAAAGNHGRREIVYPAALERVLGVAATTIEDERAPFSNYGRFLVSVAAPGENVITIFPGGHYAIASGTSFSTALVSGAAALLAATRPDIDHRDMDDAFQYSLDLGPDLGFGRIDIPSALSAVQAQVWAKPRRWMAAPAGERP